MKGMIIYIAGMLLLLPCCLMLTDDVAVDFVVLCYMLAVVFSPKYSLKAKRFWRVWHRENFRILSIIK